MLKNKSLDEADGKGTASKGLSLGDRTIILGMKLFLSLLNSQNT
jgi:hypothetical protein